MSETSLFYRAYHLRSDGHFYRAEVLEAASDDDALVKLKTIDNRHGIELWDRARFVGKAAPWDAALAGRPLDGTASVHA